MKKPRLRIKRKKNNSHGTRLIIGVFGGIFLLFAAFLAISDAAGYRGREYLLPQGVSVAGIPLGNLNEAAAAERLRGVYDLPVELRYGGARMQFLPQDLGFKADYAATLQAIRDEARGGSWWSHLWGAKGEELNQDFKLISSWEPNQARSFLEGQLAPRYDRPARAPAPYLQNTIFNPGAPGTAADLNASLGAIEAALTSATQRVAALRVQESPAPPLDPAAVLLALEANVRAEKFDGLVEVYTQRLSDGLTQHLALQNYQPVPPDVAYSGASTIKIPIMVSSYRRLDEPIGNLALGWLQAMMYRSSNDASDALMRNLMDEQRGPLVVTRDMRELGYEDTFMAGYFLPGSVLLERVNTPANTRRDIYLDPDFFNQTVPSEIGDLLGRIYRCAADKQTLFQDEVSVAECNSMLDLMAQNRIGTLIEAGLPPEARTAHKHGWTVDLDGLLRTMSDSGIVFTPGGDYVMVVFVHTNEQLIFERGNRLIARLAQTLYNSYNLNAQAAWPFE